MRTYLVDATNAVRQRGFAPGFPELEEARTREFIERLSDAARGAEGWVAIELFFDGPRRDLGGAGDGLALRFSGERRADELILGTARALRAQGRGVVVATEDGALRGEIEEEGGAAIGFRELFSRLRRGRA